MYIKLNEKQIKKLKEADRYSPEFKNLLKDIKNTQVHAAETIGNRHAMNPEAIYNWAVKYNVDLLHSGYILSNPSKFDLMSAVLNDTNKIDGFNKLTLKKK